MRRVGVIVLFALFGCRIGFDHQDSDVADARSVDVALPMCGSMGVDWAAWPIANDPGSGLPHIASHADGVAAIHDNVTNLVWQRDPGPSMTRDQAVAYCAALSLDSACWRLPQRVELMSTVDYSTAGPASTFAATTSERYWSATPAPSGAGWTLDFDAGYPETHPITEMYRVRCVQVTLDPPTDRYVTTVDTVLDQVTGLTWERNIDAGSYTFVDAQTYCATTKGPPWRSPSIQELASIVDTSRTTILVDQNAFPATPASLFWSGTTMFRDSGSGWSLDFSLGTAFRNMGMTFRVRCVHD